MMLVTQPLFETTAVADSAVVASRALPLADLRFLDANLLLIGP